MADQRHESQSEHNFGRAHRAVTLMKNDLGFTGKEIASRATELRARLYPHQKHRRGVHEGTISRISDERKKDKWPVATDMACLLERLAEELAHSRTIPFVRQHASDTAMIQPIAYCLRQGVETSPELDRQCIESLQKLLWRALTGEKVNAIDDWPEASTSGMTARIGGPGSGIVTLIGTSPGALLHEARELVRQLEAGMRSATAKGGGSGAAQAF